LLKRFNIKIQTVLIISLAFIFRLTFANICLYSSLVSLPANHNLAAHTSVSVAKGGNNQAIKSNIESFSAFDFCEEDADSEEDLIKASSPAIFSVVFSFLTYIPFITGSAVSFDLIKCNLFPKKYLALSILRI